MKRFYRLKSAAAVCLFVVCGCHPAPPPEAPAKASAAQTDRDPEADGDHKTDEHKTDKTEQQGSVMGIEKTAFGKVTDGTQVDLYTCTNDNGLRVKLTNFGAIVVSVEVPDRDGKLANINLGFDSAAGYLQDHPYFGSTVGRYCNRIAKGKFSLGGESYELATNNEPNHLHGGIVGFNKVVWQAEPDEQDDAVGVTFMYTSADGEEGYPGNLSVTAVYTLTNDDELKVAFTATTDKATPINLTNHNYWNLAGAGAGRILDHKLMIAADKYLPVDDTLIPTGDLADVTNTPLDFRSPTRLGARIEQIKADPQGYDHCFALRSQDGSLALAARVNDPASGRVMEIRTTQPGIQLYTGNFLDGSEANGHHNQHEAFCLETQHYPDSPNQPNFPSTILEPGETYSQTTVHKFLVD